MCGVIVMEPKTIIRYKLELYFDHKEDLQYILDFIKNLCYMTPEIEIKQFAEFGKEIVKHYHFEIRNKLKQPIQRKGSIIEEENP